MGLRTKFVTCLLSVFLLAGLSHPAVATPTYIVQGTGLMAPGVTTINFTGPDAPTTGPAQTGSAVTANQAFDPSTFSNLGVTMQSAALLYFDNTASDPANFSMIGFQGYFGCSNWATNWLGSSPGAPSLVLSFGQKVSAADLAVDDEPGSTSYSFYLGGVNGTLVGQFSADCWAGNNHAGFYGMTGAVFDTVVIGIPSYGGQNRIDFTNIQFQAVPEPPIALLLAIGGGACLLGAYRRQSAPLIRDNGHG